jgi:Ser/Thr protein kinase RdoA (MazF antagonist)
MNPFSPTILDRYPRSARPIGVVEPLGNAGGFSGASLWRFESPRGTLVLRSWPIYGPPASQLEQIHAWLFEAADLGFLPLPIATLEGRTIVELEGKLWELAPWLEGSADLARPPKPEDLRAMFAGLGAFHARLGRHPSQGLSQGLGARSLEINRLIFSEFNVLKAAIEQKSIDPASPLALRWLERAIKLAARLMNENVPATRRVLPLQPCLRDARPDHFLFKDQKLTGLVDFGAMGRDTVAADLARLLAESVGADRWASPVDRGVRASERAARSRPLGPLAFPRSSNF